MQITGVHCSHFKVRHMHRATCTYNISMARGEIHIHVEPMCITLNCQLVHENLSQEVTCNLQHAGWHQQRHSWTLINETFTTIVARWKMTAASLVRLVRCIWPPLNRQFNITTLPYSACGVYHLFMKTLIRSANCGIADELGHLSVCHPNTHASQHNIGVLLRSAVPPTDCWLVAPTVVHTQSTQSAVFTASCRSHAWLPT